MCLYSVQVDDHPLFSPLLLPSLVSSLISLLFAIGFRKRNSRGNLLAGGHVGGGGVACSASTKYPVPNLENVKDC